MEKNNFILKKVSSFLPSSFSSCQFRSLPDVAEGSITITKANKKILHEINHSSFLNKSQKTPQNSSKPSKQTQKKNDDQECRKGGGGAVVSINHSSSSYGGWFTSSDEKARPDDVSLSSNSGESFRLKTSRRFRRCEEMKSIDETGRCSFSSSFASADTVLSKCSRITAPAAANAAVARKTTAANAAKKTSNKKTFPEYDVSSDHLSTQLYYSKGGGRDSSKNLRRRKTTKSRRKVKKSREKSSLEYGGSMVGESYAVEKSSSDPHGDFRASMVEMIVEKQIFGADDLERLLLCFLNLNATSYHGIIYQVFTEICQTLFAN